MSTRVRSGSLSSRAPHQILTLDQLNRATLVRQLLLERAPGPPTVPIARALEQIGGLQAQEPASPYIGLWSRLADFDARELVRAFASRDVVKATLMRSTLHAVSAADYRRLLPAILPMLRAIRRQDRIQPPEPAHLRRLMQVAAAFTNEPRTLTDLRDHLGEHGEHVPPEEILWWLRRHATFVHAPSDVPWSFGRRPRVVDAEAWLVDGAFADVDAALEHLVRRYLGAFGPASVADVASWSGIAVGRLRPTIERLDQAGELRRFLDPRGRDLIDLDGAALPDPAIDAPPRLLPMWDSVLLAFADRTRIISDADRALVIAKNGDTLPSFTLDGRVAGLWWAEAEPGGRTRVVLEPFRRLGRSDRQALESEGDRLAAFVEPLEPRVYGRYRRSRARRTV